MKTITLAAINTGDPNHPAFKRFENAKAYECKLANPEDAPLKEGEVCTVIIGEEIK